MTKEKKDRLKSIEEELAYLRKELQTYMEQKPIEIHYHYYYNYDSIKPILDYYTQQEEQDDNFDEPLY